MRERLPRNRDVQILHMGKIGLGTLSRRMHLLKVDFLFWSLHYFPGGDLPLQRTHLRRTVFARILGAQQRKQGGYLQRRIALDLLHHPGPILLKRVLIRIRVL